ncbi:hypothetical protein NQ315_011029 [Exocentrus adspersus]|uniref:Uncharacterized protein n=1 Tax=Exocentrus adspersus TaxID=1586481 RepID=A0AAV8V8H4_9CUCU|nr:hypothetical protein NQ315_011029 [Exocentrus adspersus]
MVFIFFYWAPIVKNTCTIEQQSHNKIIQYSRTMSGLVIFAILTYLLKSGGVKILKSSGAQTAYYAPASSYAAPNLN